jgi:3-oxoacyl-[acyl-carrier-protein] synthase II
VTEALITPLVLAAFGNIRALSTRNGDPKAACRPFDAERDGFVFGEGGAILILEDMEFAINRGAPTFADES